MKDLHLSYEPWQTVVYLKLCPVSLKLGNSDSWDEDHTENSEGLQLAPAKRTCLWRKIMESKVNMEQFIELILEDYMTVNCFMTYN